MKAKILITDPLAEEGIDVLRQEAEVDVRLGLKGPELLTDIGDYDALAVRSETKVTAQVIEAGQRLQVIGRAGVGVDNIDVEAATNRGIVVVNAPTGNIVSAAEHTIALMLASCRNIPQAHASLKGGQWRRSEFVGLEVRNKVLGIVGLGQVGTLVTRRAQGLEMSVIAYDPFVSEDYAHKLGVEMVSLETLLARADFISVHTTLTSATKGIIGERELTLVKPAVRIMNTARGGIIDEEALYRALEEGRVAGAAIDVFSQEPAVDNILLKSNKAIVTPHLGASTAEAQTTVAVDVAHQILAVLKGMAAPYAVNAPLISPEVMSIFAPFLRLSSVVGRMAMQLAGGVGSIRISYNGEIASYDTTPLKATLLGGLLESVSEDRVNIVNVNLVASRRGLKITEHKDTVCENYGNLITVEITTPTGTTQVAGTQMRGEPHIVMINGYWLDVYPTQGYFLVSDHRDRPGLIGAVGNILGNADINISFMQVGRREARGQALMVLGLDEPVGAEQCQRILNIPDVYAVKVVKL
ncbi:MAG: phosphoglycerate dehydrogenase [Chloroflexi bacterium]|nr:phosphoglycerate dehydrogenase [Chloroflexota bacterium]